MTIRHINDGYHVIERRLEGRSRRTDPPVILLPAGLPPDVERVMALVNEWRAVFDAEWSDAEVSTGSSSPPVRLTMTTMPCAGTTGRPSPRGI